MVKIAIIKKNSCQFDDIEKHVMPLLYKCHPYNQRTLIKEKINEYIKNIIEPFIEIKDVPIDDLIETACVELTKDYSGKTLNDFYYDTEWSYTFPTRYYEMIICKPMFQHENTSMNSIGCLFSLNHNVIYDSCVIIGYKYDLTMPNYVKNTSIDIDDIIKVIRRRYFNSALLIGENSIDKYYYQNPAYLIMKVYDLDEDESVHKLPFTFLKYNLIFYSKQDCNDYVNQMATRINGVYRMYGNVLLLNEMAENINGSININEFKRLNRLSYGSLKSRELTEAEMTQSKAEINQSKAEINQSKAEINQGKPEMNQSNTNLSQQDNQNKRQSHLWSKYVVVMNRLKNIKDVCHGCSGVIKDRLMCPRCFRAVYCCEKCFANDKNHSSDCHSM